MISRNRLFRLRLVAAVLAASFAAAGSVMAAVVISSKPTANMTCSAGVCSPTANKAVLNVIDLANMLASENVTIASRHAAKDIDIEAALSWVSPSRLTLDAYRSISFDKPVTVAGTGALTITTNDGGSGGDFQFLKNAHVEFWDMSSSLVINGQGYTLVNTVASLAHGIATSPNGYFALAKSYDAKSDRKYISTPIPQTLGGTLEGLGNVISNLRLVRKYRYATGFSFISTVGVNGVVRDITLVNETITGSRFAESLGSLAVRNSGKIVHSSVSGVIQVNFFYPGGIFGGLVADNDGTIIGSFSSVAISGPAWRANGGGLVGENSGTIVDCFADGSVGASGEVSGGLVGINDNTGTITGSHATGNVSGDSSGGGLVGLNVGTIQSSFATGAVSTDSRGGGLVGAANGGVIKNTYATGSVASTPWAGGLIGTAESQDKAADIQSSYSIGAVSNASLVGGLIGEDDDPPVDIAFGYWDFETSGISDPSQGAGSPKNDPGITGLTDAQLKSGLPAGFDSAIWGESAGINNGYPYLLANPPPG